MWIFKLTIAATVAAGAAAGCGDDGGDAGVSGNLASAHGASPYLASAADTPWPDDPSADADDGRQLYLATCAACHGAGGQGLPNQGPDLRASPLLARASDAELRNFLSTGRPVGDPRNTSGLPMPPRGGNPSLTDRHLGQIANYLRTLTQPRGEAGPGSASMPVHPEERP
jgi:disulfide bond formation protein DsbB